MKHDIKHATKASWHMKRDPCFLSPCQPAWFCERIPIVSTLVDADTRLASTMRHAHAYEAQSMTWSMTRSNAAWGTKHETWSSKWDMKHEAWNMMHNTWRGHDTWHEEGWHEEGNTTWSKTWSMRWNMMREVDDLWCEAWSMTWSKTSTIRQKPHDTWIAIHVSLVRVCLHVSVNAFQ